MKNKTIEWMNKKYQLKELKQEWIKFYREEYYYNGEDGEDGKGKERTDKHFDGFGNMIISSSFKKSTISSVISNS